MPMYRVQYQLFVRLARQKNFDGRNLSNRIDCRTRRNREGTKYGNNRFGRKGKPACEHCRRRRRKVITIILRTDLKCIYTSIDSTCEFCCSRNLRTPCVKKLGPRTESVEPSTEVDASDLDLEPSRPISVYDASIRSEDVVRLQYLYLNDVRILCGSVKLNVFARILARAYGPAVTRGLRNMLIALSSTSDTGTNLRCPTQSEQQHVDIAFRSLSQKLSNPSAIEESDIFVAYTLAMWSRNIDKIATQAHIKGVIALMRHISQNQDLSASPMAPFWALIRDDLLWLMRKSDESYRLCQDFRAILGPKTIQQRRIYETELSSISPTGQSTTKVLLGRTMYASVHSMVDLVRIVDHKSQSHNDSDLDPIIESVLVELRIESSLVDAKKHELWLDLALEPLQFGQYVKDWQVEADVVGRFCGLLITSVCRLTVVALEAPSIQIGLRSAEATTAYKTLIAVVDRARYFVAAGFKDERMFGTGKSTRRCADTLGIGNSYESYLKHRTNWPCKQLLSALLRADSGNLYLREAVDRVQALANEFARFMEVIRKSDPAEPG
jgi:hypothetical protein